MGSTAEATSFYPPRQHKERHASGGDDAIKLDDLAAPDDNADLNASTTAHGLLKKLSGVATEFLDGTGNFSVPAAPVGGILINVQVFNSAGADTYIPTPGCQTAVIFALGGGGAGGGTASTSTQTAAAKGGASGGWAWFTTPVDDQSSYAVVVGSGGTPGTAGNNPGGNGTSSTIETDGGIGLVTGAGGSGGTGSAAGSTGTALAGTAGTASTGGDLNMAGTPGGGSFTLTTVAALGGQGGSTPYGAGGRQTVDEAGVAGTGFGSGGSGASAVGTDSARQGGAGRLGLIIVWEYSGSFESQFA